MSSVCSFISTSLYNRLSQAPAIQLLAAGFGCFSWGVERIKLSASSPFPQRELNCRVAATALLIAAGLTGLSIGGEELLRTPRAELLFGQNPVPFIPEDRYEQAFSQPSQLLFLGASPDTDYNGALDPSSHSPSSCISNKLRIPMKYKTLHHPLQICNEIQSASQSGSLRDLVISAHGTIDSMHLSPTAILKVFDELPANCFDGLAPDARIFLASCSTGAHSLLTPNMAEWLSWISEREVIAPIVPVFFPVGGCYTSWNNRAEITLSNRFDLIEDPLRHFNTSSDWIEKALFSIKMIVPTLLGAMTSWQMTRFGASCLHRGGQTAAWLTDRSAAPIRRLAVKIGQYNPYKAQTLYTAVKTTSKVLASTGKAANRAMDVLIQPVCSLGSWAFGKGVNAIANLAQTLYNKSCLGFFTRKPAEIAPASPTSSHPKKD